MTTLQDLLQDQLTSTLATLANEKRETVPSGEYEATPIEIKPDKAPSGNLRYKVVWKIATGQYGGKWLYQDLWLTSRAIYRTRKELATLGLEPATIDPLPTDKVYLIRVRQRTSDSGATWNDVDTIVKYLRQDTLPIGSTVKPHPTPEVNPRPRNRRPSTLVFSKANRNGSNKSVSSEPKPIETVQEPKPIERATKTVKTEPIPVPDYVAVVANTIKVNHATPDNELQEALGISLREPYWYEAMNTLRKHGVKEVPLHGTVCYWWDDKRPQFIWVRQPPRCQKWSLGQQ